MTIHHDKMAYGRLSPLREDASQQALDEMTSRLCEREYDRMIRGELYNPADAELCELRTRVRELFRAYNNTSEADKERRAELLHAMFGGHGDRIYCEPPLRFDYGINTTVGEDFFSNFNLTVLDCAPVKIGRQCFIGPNVTIATPVHPMLSCDRNMRPDGKGGSFDYEYARPITIGDNVWLASNVVICGGVTIGDDCVIGAGSVVTKDTPPRVFDAASPGRGIRPLTEKDKMKLPCEE